MAKPRVLHCVTVYNGRSFVPRALASAMRMDTSLADVDVLALDDASPEPGWSADLRALCAELGCHYYLTPRNLGIPRMVSLGMLVALKEGYDYVVINNSDVIFPRNCIAQLLAAVRQPKVGSATAWSNNVSVFSLPNEDAPRHLANQEAVDWIAARNAERFGDAILDVPAGISFCIMMPTGVVREVGVMDPVFGRGYCEETDWSLRSLKAGYRVALALGTFVYHMGQGTNLAAGLVPKGATTVPENEAIVAYRYPDFGDQVRRFMADGLVDAKAAEAIAHLIDAAARDHDYVVDVGWLRHPSPATPDRVQVDIAPGEGEAVVRLSYLGFVEELTMRDDEIGPLLRRRLGERTPLLNVYDRAPLVAKLTKDLRVSEVRSRRNYPSRI